MNFPTDVSGISATNSISSGSHHFANFGARNASSSSGGRGLTRLQHHDRQRALVPLGMRHGDDGGFGDRRMAHQRGLERHGADPLAAGLHQVLRRSVSSMQPPRRDRHDVAGPEPAVFGEPGIGARRVVVLRRRPTDLALRARPSSRRPRGRSRRRRGRGSRRTASACPASRDTEAARPAARSASSVGHVADACRAASSRSCPTRG